MIQHLIHRLHVSDDVFGFELLLEDRRTQQRGKHDLLIELLDIVEGHFAVCDASG